MSDTFLKTMDGHFAPNIVLHSQRGRLMEILARFVRADDKALNDAQFIEMVMNRYRADRAAPLVDPNE